MAKSKRIIGLMSGTSLDGLDVCCADFSFSEGNYQYKIVSTNTFNYSELWTERLRAAVHLNNAGIATLEIDFALLMAKYLKIFLLENRLNGTVDFITSHGHTVFHQPDEKITVQIGDGQTLSDSLGVQVINDFRIGDVLLGGQGAPLVPIGDRLLFSDYEACLNLGGIANISFEKDDNRIAFDICPANMTINYLVNKKFNINFDKNGEIAKSGQLIPELYASLNMLAFYSTKAQKSLGFEWMNEYFLPIVNNFSERPMANILNTIVRQEVHQIHKVCIQNRLKTVLITGGGVYNSFFVECLKEISSTQYIIPNSELVDFKEALIFGFLGYLKDRQEINILSSVTGACHDSIGGISWIPAT